VPRVGEPDGSNPKYANVWNGGRWVPARVSRGGKAWVWDNKTQGTCGVCAGPVGPGQTVYRMPTRPLNRAGFTGDSGL